MIKLYKLNDALVIGDRENTVKSDELTVSFTGTWVTITIGDTTVDGEITTFTDATGAPYANKAAILAVLDLFTAGTNTTAASTIIALGAIAQIPKMYAVTFSRPTNITPYDIGDALNTTEVGSVAYPVTGVVKAVGGSAILMNIFAKTNDIVFAGKSIRIKFYKGDPGTVYGDNIPALDSFTNPMAETGYVDILFQARKSTSDVVYGVADVLRQFTCNPSSTQLKVTFEVLDAVTPTSGSSFEFNFEFIQL